MIYYNRSMTTPHIATRSPPISLARRVFRTLAAGNTAPLYRQIAAAVRWEIGMGRCPVGAALPAIRAMAAALGVNYHTVRRAYDELVAEGVVESRRGAGTVVQRRPEREARQVRRAFVLECNLTDAAELARDAEAAYRIRAHPWVLEHSGEPPAGILLGTRFHAVEIRERWPHRRGDLYLVDRDPDPALRAIIGTTARTCGATRLVLVEQDRITGRRMAGELGTVLAPLRFSIRVVAPPRPDRVPDRFPSAVVLYAPRIWDRLPWAVRSHPRALLARFCARPDSLARIADRLGWPGRHQLMET